MAKTIKAKSAIFVGSVKSGFLRINANEIVNVVKETKKTFAIEKNGIIKSISKDCFYAEE